MNYLAIDPGEVYCGVVEAVGFKEYEMGVKAHTWTPEHLLDYLLNSANYVINYDVVIIEEFRLYPWTAKSLIWSDMPVCKLIGKIEYICERNGIEVVLQKASIKKLPFVKKELKGKKFKTQHEKDAYMHLVYYLEGEKNNKSKSNVK